MERLHLLYQDKATLEELKNLFDIVLKEVTQDRVFNRKDVTGIADAKDIIEATFNRLDEMYALKKKGDTTNQGA